MLACLPISMQTANVVVILPCRVFHHSMSDITHNSYNSFKMIAQK